MSLLLLPKQINDIRFVLRALDWHVLEEDIEQEAQARMAIVGPVNSGKSTLFNYLHGRYLSATSAVPGTTKGVVEHPIGPFLLIDTPGLGEVWGVDRADTSLEAARQADIVILLLDAGAGIRQSDRDLYDSLTQLRKPVVVAINKIDLVKRDLPWILENSEQVLGVRPVAISARSGAGVTEVLLPAILKARPEIAVAMARSLPAVRKQLVHRIIHQTAWITALTSLEPIPGLDIPLLLAAQTRMVLRLAAAYGQSMRVSYARELLTTIAGGLTSRYLALQLAKLVPGLGWLVSAALAAISTWGMGHAAATYFEAGATLKGSSLRALYQRLRRTAPAQLTQRTPTIGSIEAPTGSSSGKDPGGQRTSA